jgi:predicted nucleotidyltransferase
MGIKNAEANPSSSRPASTSMADALFSGTRQKLLGFLFGQPENTYTLGELIERARAGSGAVQREVTRLVESGLVRVECKGRSRLYRANPDAPIFEELCQITRKLFGPREIIRAALEPLSQRLQMALLYGSVASREDKAGSDVDVLIVSDELLLEEVYAALTEAERSLGRQVNPTLYTTDEFRQRREANNHFLADVLGGEYRILLGELV